MPIPNAPSLYQKIAKGAEGGLEFARIINQLLIAEAKDTDSLVMITNDSAGDYKGVDCIMKTANGLSTVGFQYKYYPSSLSNQHKARIEESLENAVKQFPEMEEWILITPEDFIKSEAEWFDALKVKYELQPESIDLGHKKLFFGTGRLFTIQHWGHSQIISLMLQYPHIGRYYYREELFAKDEGKLALSKISVDTDNTIWYQSAYYNRFKQGAYNPDLAKSSELVFDIQFINNSENIYHLEVINIYLEKIWTKLKGFSKDEILKSVGIIEVDIDFNKKINSYNLDSIIGGPIVFNPKTSKRFGLQLNSFAKKCPGNMATISIEFVFNDLKLKSQSITLDF